MTGPHSNSKLARALAAAHTSGNGATFTRAEWMRLLNTITQTKRERTGLASRLQEHGYTELRVHLTAKALQRLGVAAAAEPAVAQPRYMDGSPFGSR